MLPRRERETATTCTRRRRSRRRSGHQIAPPMTAVPGRPGRHCQCATAPDGAANAGIPLHAALVRREKAPGTAVDVVGAPYAEATAATTADATAATAATTTAATAATATAVTAATGHGGGHHHGAHHGSHGDRQLASTATRRPSNDQHTPSRLRYYVYGPSVYYEPSSSSTSSWDRPHRASRGAKTPLPRYSTHMTDFRCALSSSFFSSFRRSLETRARA